MKDNKLITVSSPSINLVGDKVLAEQFIGPAKSQMRILENSMKFQNLSQAIRRVKLNADVYVECVRVFKLSIINIVANSVSSKALKVIEDTLSDLYIVFGPYEVKLSLSSVEIAFTPGSSISCPGGCAGEITYVDLLSGESQVIYGHFTGYSDGALITSGAASGVNSYSQYRYYRHDYRYFKLANNNISNEVFYDGFKIESAFDFYTPFEDAISEDWDVKEWSKTLKTFMVVARLREPKDITGSEDDPFENYSNIQYYFQAAYNGKEVTWGSSQTLGPYFRYKIVDDYYDVEDHLLYQLHIGFDLWEDDEEDFFAGIMLDSTAKLSIYKLNKLTYKMELQTEYTSTVRDDYYTYLDETYLPSDVGDIRYTNLEKKAFIRLLGYGYKKETDEHVAYWGDITHEVLKVEPIESLHVVYGSNYNEANNFYCSEVLNLATSEKHYFETKYTPESFPSRLQAQLVSAIWNPLTRTIKFVYLDATRDKDEDTFEGPCEDKPWLDCYTYNESVSYGDFILGEIKLSLGSTDRYIETIEDTLTDSQANSYDAKRYKLERMIFTPNDDLVFYYGVNDLVQVSPCNPKGREEGAPPLSEMTVLNYDCLSYNGYCYDDEDKPCGSNDYDWYDHTDPNCECIDFNWITQSYGDISYLKYASDKMQHDEGWTAVLLSGEDGNNVVHENWIIYKDLETPGNYLAVSSSGIKKILTGIDRAFFFQYYEE